ncbi:MAG: 6-bladed beta-propeller [Anaerolineales bacterium]|nr:6-bladed beta-propeller [Anaerolineales bacterium]
MTQTFNCPNCGAPLDYQGNDPIIRCPYCQTSVIVPDNLRARPNFSPDSHQFAVGGSNNLADLIGQAKKLSEAKKFAQAGETEKAVSAYREATGADEAAAHLAVGKLAAGMPIRLNATSSNIDFSSAPPIQIGTNVSMSSNAKPARKGGCLIPIVAIIILITSLSRFATNWGISSITKMFGVNGDGKPSVSIDLSNLPVDIPNVASGVATKELSFGGEGNGAGFFDDARAIAVNPSDGAIYVAEYSTGRIQAFDAEGTFLTQWIIPKENKNKPYINEMAVMRDGSVFVPVWGNLKAFNADGTFARDINMGNDYVESLVVAPDGNLIAIANGEDILWLSPQGKVLQRVNDAVSTISEDSELDSKVAVDGLGKVYVLGTFNNAVFVYDSTGKYLNRFGSTGDQPGQFRAPMAIAVDGQGRVYVSDIRSVQIFSDDGRYLDAIKMSGVLGIRFDNQGYLYAVGNNQVAKYKLNK